MGQGGTARGGRWAGEFGCAGTHVQAFAREEGDDGVASSKLAPEMTCFQNVV